jgi:EPS-associated MarR family transcriptional regulator
MTGFCGSLSGANIMIVDNQEYYYRTLKLLQKTPELTQRQIAEKLGVSLGKGHYVVKALIDVGCLKIDNFQKSDNKIGSMYKLTAKGVREKARLAKRFLKSKQDEYKQLQKEIRSLKGEVQKQG